MNMVIMLRIVSLSVSWFARATVAIIEILDKVTMKRPSTRKDVINFVFKVFNEDNSLKLKLKKRRKLESDNFDTYFITLLKEEEKMFLKEDCLQILAYHHCL